ncbi:unnamed protein product [Closterium sp. NIES-65]|nr:unnamed protein product [Closterium sp. NIES-65]
MGLSLDFPCVSNLLDTAINSPHSLAPLLPSTLPCLHSTCPCSPSSSPSPRCATTWQCSSACWGCCEANQSPSTAFNRSHSLLVPPSSPPPPQVRNHLAVLFLSLGVPVLTAGDEYGHSKDAQLGADYSSVLPSSPSSLSHLSSPLPLRVALRTDLGVQLTRFIASLANFRRRRTLLLQRKDFYFGEDIVWHGAFPNQPEWDNPNCCFLACTVHSAGIESSAKEAAEEAGVPITTAAPAVAPSMPVGDLYFAFNAHANEMIVELPAPPVGMMWHLVLDTAKDYPADATELPAQGMPPSIAGRVSSPYYMEAFSVIALEARGPPSLAPRI